MKASREKCKDLIELNEANLAPAGSEVEAGSPETDALTDLVLINDKIYVQASPTAAAKKAKDQPQRATSEVKRIPILKRSASIENKPTRITSAGKAKKFKCERDECGKEFAKDIHLQTHMSRMHTEYKDGKIALINFFPA